VTNTTQYNMMADTTLVWWSIRCPWEFPWSQAVW